jgi:hypothetical protein
MLVDLVEQFINLAPSYVEQFHAMADGRLATDVAQVDMFASYVQSWLTD